jgi:hypothetical protein
MMTHLRCVTQEKPRTPAHANLLSPLKATEAKSLWPGDVVGDDKQAPEDPVNV